MNYQNDIRFIIRQLPSQRKELIETSVYTNDFKSALECLRHSRSVDHAEVLAMARRCMLKDANLIRSEQ